MKNQQNFSIEIGNMHFKNAVEILPDDYRDVTVKKLKLNIVSSYTDKALVKITKATNELTKGLVENE